MARLMVERIISFGDAADELDFEKIEQRIATVEVDNPQDWTPERLVERAYSDANMRPRESEHRITRLGDALTVER